MNSEDNPPEPVLSFHHVAPGDWTLMARLRGTHLYPLGHLAGPQEMALHSEAITSAALEPGGWSQVSLRVSEHSWREEGAGSCPKEVRSRRN